MTDRMNADAADFTAGETVVEDEFLEVRPAVTVMSASDTGAGIDGLPAEFIERRKKQKHRKMVKIGVAAAVACMAVAGGIGWYVASHAADEADQVSVGSYVESVTKGDLDMTIEGSGTLAASSVFDVSSDLSGEVTRVFVEVGDKVAVGDKLFTMTSDDLEDRIDDAKDSAFDASSSYSAAKSSYNSAASSYSSAKKKYASAKKAYEKAKKQAAKEAKAAASAASAAPAGTTSAAGLEDEPASGSTGLSPLAAGDGRTDGGSAGGSSASGATTTATTTTAGASDPVAEAKQAMEQAKTALDQAKQQQTQAKQQKSQAYSQYAKAVEARDELVADRAKLTVKAESAGVVTAVNVAAGDSVGSGSSSSGAGAAGTSGAGGSSSSGASGLICISDESKLSMTVQVSEYEINNVKKGQPATVTVTALEKDVDATVSCVSMTASSSTSGSSTTAYYDVVLTIGKPTSDMREGMNATAVITNSSLTDVLLVPVGAVTTKGSDASFVTVVQGNAQAQDSGATDASDARGKGAGGEAGQSDSADQQTRRVEVTVLGENDTYAAVEPVNAGELAEGDQLQVTYRITSSSSSSSSQQGMGNMGNMGGMMGGPGGDPGSNRGNSNRGGSGMPSGSPSFGGSR